MKLMNVIKEFNVQLWIFLYCASNLHKQHPSCVFLAPRGGGVAFPCLAALMDFRLDLLSLQGLGVQDVTTTIFALKCRVFKEKKLLAKPNCSLYFSSRASL